MTSDRFSRARRRLRAGAWLWLILAGHAIATPEGIPAEAITTGTVTDWAERTFPPLLEQNRMTGAVVSVVKDGRVLLSRGYGRADVTAGTPADPARTRVRIGSVTKTFTATLLAQLLEEGRIASIDDPVNAYLARVQLPDNGGIAITLRHLLTHSAGFEDRFFHIGTVAPVSLPASAGHIERLRPAYVRPAGQRIVYSNYGVAVLGWLIEDVTGNAVDEEMRRRLLDPAGMAATALAVSVDPPDGLARPGQIGSHGIVGEVPFTAINPAIAQTGSIVSTADDMARYLNAQLGHGFLSDTVLQRLHDPLHDSGPGTTALAMAFFVDDWADRTVVSHGGNWAGFHSWLTLLPEDGLGLFVTVLGEPAPEGLGTRLLRAAAPGFAGATSPALATASGVAEGFLLHLYGPRRALPEPQPVDAKLARNASGAYQPARRPQTTMEAVSALVFLGAGTLDVAMDGHDLHLGAAGPWWHDGESSFVLDAPTRPSVHLRSAADGTPLLIPALSIYDFERIAVWRDPRLHALIVHAGIPLTLLGLLAAVHVRRNRWLFAPALVGAAGLVLILVATMGLADGHTLMTGYYAGAPARLILFVAAANVQLIAAVGTVPAALTTSRWTRRLVVVSMAAAVVVALVLWQHNAVGFPRV